MKKNRVIYYKDELSDEFSSAQIKPISIDENYIYDRKTKGKILHTFWYKIIARPLAYIFLKIKFGHKIINKEVLKIMKEVSRMAKGKYQEWLEPEGLLKIEGWARDGLTDEQIAQNMGITAKTLYEWKKKYSEICESLKRNKDVADRQVENALFENAINGNITAQIFWLKNRKPDKWRDKQEYEDRTAIEKLDEILKGLHDNAAKQKTE